MPSLEKSKILDSKDIENAPRFVQEITENFPDELNEVGAVSSYLRSKIFFSFYIESKDLQTISKLVAGSVQEVQDELNNFEALLKRNIAKLSEECREWVKRVIFQETPPEREAKAEISPEIEEEFLKALMNILKVPPVKRKAFEMFYNGESPKVIGEKLTKKVTPETATAYVTTILRRIQSDKFRKKIKEHSKTTSLFQVWLARKIEPLQIRLNS